MSSASFAGGASVSVLGFFRRQVRSVVVLLACAAVLLVGARRSDAQSFRAAPMMATKIHPNSIAFADFNGDNLLDMAVPQYEGGLTIHIGNGAGEVHRRSDVLVRHAAGEHRAGPERRR